MSLVVERQANFSAGIVQGPARHLIPNDGFYDAINTLLDDDGLAYKRGGSVDYSTSEFANEGLTMIWDGYLTPGPRTVIANNDDFAVLNGSLAPVTLGGAGLAGPNRCVELDGILFLPGGSIYGGSLKASAYSTGTVGVTNDSATVTGSGFTTNVDVGMLLRISSERVYVVKSIESNTSLTLTTPYEGTTGTKAYALSPFLTPGAPYKNGTILATAGNRLLVCDGDRVDFTPWGSPHSFNADEDYHLLSEGAEITGAAGIEDVAYIFATNGLWVLNNLNFDIVDDVGNRQQTLSQINRDLILWSHAGIATWRRALVVPATDGVWLVSSNEFKLLTRSVSKIYRQYVRAGHHTGLAEVFDNHYHLPILDSAENVVDVLVCRLDRPTQTDFGGVNPWTRFEGAGADVAGFAVHVGSDERRPQLLGAHRQEGHVIDCTGFYAPGVANKRDHDDSEISWILTLRDVQTNGTGNALTANLVAYIKANYELIDAGTDNPTITAYFSDGSRNAGGSYWGSSYWGSGAWSGGFEVEFDLLEGVAPEDDGREPYTWRVAKRCRYSRIRLQCEKPCARLSLRSVETHIRRSSNL